MNHILGNNTQRGYRIVTCLAAVLLTASQVLAVGGRGARRGELRNFVDFYNEYNRAADQIVDVERQLSELTQKQDKIQQRKHRLARELRDLEDEKHNLKQRIHRNQSELETHQSSLAAAQAQKPNLKKQVDRLNQKVQSERAAIAPLQNKLNATNKQWLETQNQLKKLKKLKKRLAPEIQELNKTLKFQESLLANANKRIPELVKTIEANNTKLQKINQRIKALKTEKSKHEAEYKVVEKQFKKTPRGDNKKALHKKLVGLQLKIKSLKGKIENKKKERRPFKARVDAAQKQKAQMDKLAQLMNTEIPKTKSKINQKNAELAKYNSKIPETKNAENKLAKEVSQLRNKLKVASKGLNQAVTEHRAAHTKLVNTNQRIDRLTQSISESTVNIKRSQGRLKAVRQEIPDNKKQLENVKDRLIAIDREVNASESKHSQLLDIMDFPVMSTNNGQIVNIFVGGDRRLSPDTQYVVERSLEQGQKIMMWVISMPNSDVIYRIEGLTGVHSIYGMYDSDLFVGEGALSGIYLQSDSERDYLEINANNAILLQTREQRVAMTANRVSDRGVVITTTINPNTLSRSEGRQLMAKIAASYPESLAPTPVEPAPPRDEAPSETVVVTKDKLDLAIPDYDANGVSVELNIKAPYGSTVADLQLYVEITHSYIGDLEIELIAPSGKTKTVRSRSGGSQDDLVLNIDGSELADFLHEEASGTWSLVIKDKAKVDLGTVENVRLEVVTQ